MDWGDDDDDDEFDLGALVIKFSHQVKGGAGEGVAGVAGVAGVECSFGLYPCGCADQGAEGGMERQELGLATLLWWPGHNTKRNPLDKFSYLCRPDDDIIFNTTTKICMCVCVALINVRVYGVCLRV